jgi:hypothetical protein
MRQPFPRDRKEVESSFSRSGNHRFPAIGSSLVRRSFRPEARCLLIEPTGDHGRAARLHLVGFSGPPMR